MPDGISLLFVTLFEHGESHSSFSRSIVESEVRRVLFGVQPWNLFFLRPCLPRTLTYSHSGHRAAAAPGQPQRTDHLDVVLQRRHQTVGVLNVVLQCGFTGHPPYCWIDRLGWTRCEKIQTKSAVGEK